MSHLQEMLKKTMLPEVLSASGGTLKQLSMSTSTYSPEKTEQSGKIYHSSIFCHRVFDFSFSRHLKDGSKKWL